MGSTLSFEEFFRELCSNYVWFQPASMQHEPKTFEETARKVYMQYVASEHFPPIQEARRHVYNKLVLVPGDRKKVDWTKIAKKELEEKEAAKKPEWIPVSEEEREKRLAEYKAMVDALPKRWSPPEMSEEEKEHQGVLRKKHEPFVRSEVETMEVFNQHKMKVDEARRKYFKSAYPDASEEEIKAYIKKFDKI
jgi:hypothetical protein